MTLSAYAVFIPPEKPTPVAATEATIPSSSECCCALIAILPLVISVFRMYASTSLSITFTIAVAPKPAPTPAAEMFATMVFCNTSDNALTLLISELSLR